MTRWALARTVVTVLFLLFLAGGQTRAQGALTVTLTEDGISYPVSWQHDGSGLLITRLSGKVRSGTGWQLLTDLWQVGLDTHQKRLAQNASYPVLSPDGTMVAYLSFNGSRQADLYVLTIQTGQTRRLTHADWGHALQWSPVGQGIIFARGGSPWLIGHNGGSPHPLAGDLSASSFQLSPEGDRWAMQSGQGLRLFRPGRPTISLATGQTVQSFAWSPRGKHLAYVVDGALWTASSEGLAQRRLLSAEGQHLGPPRWSPDGQQIAVIRTPLHAAGRGESELWVVMAGGSGSRRLSANLPVDDSPLWSPDGQRLAFASEGNVVLLNINVPAQPAGPSASRAGSRVPPPLPAAGPRTRVGAPLTPPATIRVLHHPNNTCRNVPDWQVDAIDFETYVKRVVPREMPAGWEPEALRAQAVAARTYAWYYVLQNNPNYDVNDSTGYQLMCDSQDPRSDAAVDATRGQYVAYEGRPILAEYSAENSSPTVVRAGYPYLQAVEDPVSLGKTRIGHGRGMGQVGALRWASSPFDWAYQQILSHYYTGVSVEAPAGPASDSTPPLGAVILPWSGIYLTSNRVLIRANASDEASGVAQVDFWAQYRDHAGSASTLLYRDTDGNDGWQTVWDVSALPEQPLSDQGITITVALRDATGNETTGLGSAHVGLDRHPPTGTMDIPVAASQTVSIPLTIDGADDPNGSGLARMAFSNDWRWNEDSFLREVVTQTVPVRVGQVVSDSHALNGFALYGRAGVDPAGAWYGPYTPLLPPGQIYRAYFRLKTDNVLTAEEVAYLDVVDDYGNKVLGIHRVRGIDFRQAGVYQEFAVDFDYLQAGSAGLEFRTAFRGTANLWLDRVLVVRYPQPYASSTTWALRDSPGWQQVIAKLIDGAGNVSVDLQDRVYYLPPVIGWNSFLPTGWVTTTLTPAAQIAAQATAGLDTSTAAYRYSNDGSRTWSDWLPAATPATSGTTQGQTLLAETIPFGRQGASNNSVQFRISDLAGHNGISPAYLVPIDVQPPTTTLYSPPLATTSTFTVTWQGGDNVSGVSTFDIQVRDGVDGSWQDWLVDTPALSAPFAGVHNHRYYFRARARDVAGNVNRYAEGLGQSSTLVSDQDKTYLPAIFGAYSSYPYPGPP